MKKIYLLHLSWLMILVVGLCGRPQYEFREIETIPNIPVTVLQPGSTTIDLDLLIQEAQTKVREKLPLARYDRIAYSGKCEHLLELEKGVIHLEFIQFEESWFEQAVLGADATIKPEQETMDLYFWSDTDRLPETDPLVTDEQFREILHIAHQHLSAAGVSDCSFTVGQLGKVWNVYCSSAEDEIMCRFGIDAETGKITKALYGPSIPIP